MITPALDLQAAPQMVDGVRPQAAQPDGSGESGDFGAAFTASLSSSSSPAPVVSDSGTTGAQRTIQQNPVTAHNTSDRSASPQKTFVDASVSATSVRLPVKSTALILQNAGAKDSSVDALNEALASVTTKTGAAAADSSDAKAAPQTPSKSGEPLNAAAADSQLSLKNNKDGVVDGKVLSVAAINVAELKASLVDASRPLTSEVSDTSKTSSLSKGSESTAKSKVGAHDSQLVASNITGDALLSSLVTGAPALTAASLTTTTALAKEAVVEGVSAPKAQLSLPTENPVASAKGLSATATAAGKSSLVTAWNVTEVETSSARSTVTTAAPSGFAHSELVHALGAAGNSSAVAAASSKSIEQSGSGQITPLGGSSLTPQVATGLVKSGEATASLASTSLPKVAALTHQDLRSNAPSVDVSSASSVNTTAPAISIATDAISSSLSVKPQNASVEPPAGHPLNSAGQVRNATTGDFAPAIHAAQGAAQSAATRAIGVMTPSAPSVQADARTAPNGDPQRQVAAPAVASAAAPPTIKQPVVPTERAGNSRPSVPAAGTDAVSSTHRGSLDTSTATPDRDASSDAASNVVTGHADASPAGPSHSASVPTLDLSNSSIVSAANIAATVAHQGTAGAITSSSQNAVGGVGASAVQAAGTEALHGAGALNDAISSQPHQTLAATPTSLEVGVHSGTQGWLKIRAEVGDQGDVTASLASTSASGQQTLKGQLPALNAYLQSEQMSVTTSVAERIGATHVAVAHEASLGSSSAGTGSTGQDASLLQSGAGQGAFSQGGGQQGGGPDRSSSAVDSGRSEVVQSYASRVESSGPTPGSTAVDGSGRWLNVRV